MTHVPPKKLTEQALIGQAGINLVERRLLDMGYAWHPGNAALDAGIDGYVELRDQSTGAALNLVLQLQSKATKSPWIAETDASFEFVCEERDLAYWMGGNAPVVLVVSRPKDNEAYWVAIRTYFADPIRLKERRIVFDKSHNRFDASARDALMALAVPRDAGFYTAPLPISEPLYSNLLEVASLPRTVFIGQTTVTDRAEVKKRLHSAGVRDIEWVMRGERVLSVHDLRTHGWRDVVDRGTVEDHDGAEWGAIDEQLRRDDFNDFSNLLSRCLSARLRRLGVRFDDAARYYYFQASRDLSQRRIAYQSLKRGSKRVVFDRYATKRGDTVREWYRHSAFAGRFRRFDGRWFLEVTPEYHFTSDGWQPLRFAESKRAGIKALERNGTVLGQVVMWADLLRPATLPDLFADAEYPYLRFGELERFTLEAGINEDLWLGSESDVEVRLAGMSWDGLPLFPAMPSPYADEPSGTTLTRPTTLGGRDTAIVSRLDDVEPSQSTDDDDPNRSALAELSSDFVEDDQEAALADSLSPTDGRPPKLGKARPNADPQDAPSPQERSSNTARRRRRR